MIRYRHNKKGQVHTRKMRASEARFTALQSCQLFADAMCGTKDNELAFSTRDTHIVYKEPGSYTGAILMC